jgi:hypothetical protein
VVKGEQGIGHMVRGRAGGRVISLAQAAGDAAGLVPFDRYIFQYSFFEGFADAHILRLAIEHKGNRGGRYLQAPGYIVYGEFVFYCFIFTTVNKMLV